ncbi:hypothetical protein [Oceanospirillum linum]|nr:hypothetical protein [Oceanospirillum linum]SEF72328.1 hypothetical protein SAMN04489856_10291 [Oleiphilus messinensis]SMP16021.1 hypothetical protein SAMN06264348_10389 [Oceanospirillum linum]
MKTLIMKTMTTKPMMRNIMTTTADNLSRPEPLLQNQEHHHAVSDHHC